MMNRDPGKKRSSTRNPNHMIYMDLKDVIREHALPFLPAKSLCRFRSVSREWRLQISSPFFWHKQSLSFRALSGIFYQTPRALPTFISIDPKSCGVPDLLLSFLPEPVEIRSSSSGLLCCQSQNGDGTYYVCNPVTQQWNKLPKPTANHGPDPAIVLIFEPSLMNFTAEYKLICAFPSSDFDDALEFEIYSSVDGSWKISGEISFSSTRRSVLPSSGVYANNVVYWKMGQYGVLAFDLVKDRSQILQAFHSTNVVLGNMNGKLCSAETIDGSTVGISVLSNIHYNTMEIGSHARLFNKRRHVALDSSILGRDAPRELVAVGNDLLVVKCGSKLFSIDLRTKETKLLAQNTSSNGVCIPYVNSLVSI